MASFKHLLLCLMFLFGIGFSQGSNCYDDVDECNKKLQALMLDESAFTFGTDYAEMCSYKPPPGNCINSNETQKSMYSKIFNTVDATELANRVAGLSVLSVAYDAPAESYEACGHIFNVPAMKHVVVDPLKDYPHSLRSLTYRPTITWTQSDPDDLYTVMMYDVHFSFLHGLYVNCRGGSWMNCDTIWTYAPPGFFFPNQNPYTFMLFKQANKQAFPVDAMKTAVNDMVVQTDATPFLGLFPFTPFYKSYGGTLGNPIALNVIRVYGDPYNVGEIKKRSSADLCPWYFSQLDVFHRVVKNTGLEATWSSPKFTRSLYSENTYMPTLTVNIQAHFSNDKDLEYTSCCRNYAFSQGTHFVDPFTNASLPAAAVRSKPVISLTPTQLNWKPYQAMKDATYVFLMMDVTPSLPDKTVDGNVYLHWVIADVKNADITYGKELWKFLEPLPPSTGTYFFLLFEQGVETMADDAISSLCPNPPVCLVQLQKLLKALSVSSPIGLRWFRVERDPYVDLNYYSVLKLFTEKEVCKDRPGYASPCPRVPDCDRSANLHYDRLTVVGLSLFTLAAAMSKRLF